VVFSGDCCAFCIPGKSIENFMGPVHPSVSRDGSIVTFSTNACNVTDDVTQLSAIEGVRVHQHFVTQFSPTASEPDAVFVTSSRTPGGIASDGSGLASSVARDGGAVVFVHNSYLLATGERFECSGPAGAGCPVPTPQQQNVYFKLLDDVGTPTIHGEALVRVSTTAQVGVTSGQPRISDRRPDGHYRVAFPSTATDLSATTPLSGGNHIYVWDSLPGAENVWISSNPGQTDADRVDISADGDWVVWRDSGVDADQVYRRRIPNGIPTRTVLVSHLADDENVGQSGRVRQPPAVSGDGSVVVFDSNACLDDDFVDDSMCTDFQQIYRWTEAEGNQLISTLDAATGIPGNGASIGARVSRDGRFVAYISGATNLESSGLAAEVDPDNPREPAVLGDIFLYDHSTGTNTLLTANTSGENGVLDLSLSDDGETLWVVFSSRTPDTEFDPNAIDNCPSPQGSCPAAAACDNCNLNNICPEAYETNPCMDVYRLRIDL